MCIRTGEKRIKPLLIIYAAKDFRGTGCVGGACGGCLSRRKRMNICFAKNTFYTGMSLFGLERGFFCEI